MVLFTVLTFRCTKPRFIVKLQHVSLVKEETLVQAGVTLQQDMIIKRVGKTYIPLSMAQMVPNTNFQQYTWLWQNIGYKFFLIAAILYTSHI